MSIARRPQYQPLGDLGCSISIVEKLIKGNSSFDLNFISITFYKPNKEIAKNNSRQWSLTIPSLGEMSCTGRFPSTLHFSFQSYPLLQIYLTLIYARELV